MLSQTVAYVFIYYHIWPLMCKEISSYWNAEAYTCVSEPRNRNVSMCMYEISKGSRREKCYLASVKPETWRCTERNKSSYVFSAVREPLHLHATDGHEGQFIQTEPAGSNWTESIFLPDTTALLLNPVPAVWEGVFLHICQTIWENPADISVAELWPTAKNYCSGQNRGFLLIKYLDTSFNIYKMAVLSRQTVQSKWWIEMICSGRWG